MKEYRLGILVLLNPLDKKMLQVAQEKALLYQSSDYSLARSAGKDSN